MDAIISSKTEVLAVKETSTSSVVITETQPIVISGDTTTAITVERDTTNYISIEADQVLSNTEVRTNTIVSIGGQGPQGPAGASTTYLYMTAGMILSGHRVVCNSDIGLVYASASTVASASSIIGITTGAVLNGALAEVQIASTLEEPSWTWTINDPIFVGDNGLLTQIPPTSGYVCIIGFAVSSTKILIDKQAPILLG